MAMFVGKLILLDGRYALNSCYVRIDGRRAAPLELAEPAVCRLFLRYRRPHPCPFKDGKIDQLMLSTRPVSRL